MKLRWNFSQQMHQIHSIVPQTNILGRFGPFCYCTKVDEKLAEQAPLAIHFIGPKTHVLGVLDHFATA
jgi:hypothetical protein